MIKKTAELRLNRLFDLFPGDGLRTVPMEVLPPDQVPDPYGKLLVHAHHMTVTLEERYGTDIDLQVLEERHEGDVYARKLTLSVGDPDDGGRVVMTGMMRIALQFCGVDVRDTIVAGKIPLGRVLIQSGVLRWIEPHAFLRLTVDEELSRLFRCGKVHENDSPGVTYGRIARLICDGDPAVELLEIVAPEGDP